MSTLTAIADFCEGYTDLDKCAFVKNTDDILLCLYKLSKLLASLNHHDGAKFLRAQKEELSVVHTCFRIKIIGLSQ